MAVRFSGSYGTTYYNTINVYIHDEDYVGSVNPITQFVDSGLIEKSEGIHTDPIKPTSYKCSIYMDSEELMTWFSDLIEAPEGRFHLEVRRSSTLLFYGRIIVDAMSLDIALNPMFTFMAIDGLTLLKNVQYTIDYAPNRLNNVKDLIVNCLNHNDVVIKMMTGTDKLVVIASNLQFDDAYYDSQSFYLHACLDDYFYTLEKNSEERLKVWDVLIEVLNRFGLNIRYWKGAYYVFGCEYPAEFYGYAKGYTKDGDSLGALTLNTSSLTVDNLALTGGKYYFENGLKRVQINAKKEFANAYFGENLSWIKTNNDYQAVGSLPKDSVYQALITIDVTKLIYEATGPYPPFFSVKMWVKETNLSTSAVTYLKTTPQQIKHNTVTIFNLENAGASVDFTEIAYVLQAGKMEATFKFPSMAYDRSIEVKFQFYQYLKYDYTVIGGSPQVNTLDYVYRLKLGAEPMTTAGDIYFRATVPGDNIKERIINNLACDYNGNDAGKVYFHDGGGSTEIRKSQNEWRFANTETFGPLEPAICRKILEYYDANLKKLTISCNVPTISSETSAITWVYITTFRFDDENFFTSEIEINHFQDIIRLTGVKVNTKSVNTITAYNVRNQETNPQGKTTIGDTSGFGSYNEYQKGKTEVHVMDVVGNDLQLTYEIPTGSSFASIRQSIAVFVEGVRWRHVDTLGTVKATYSLGDDGLITFYPYVPNKNVIVDIENYFETGISS